MDDEPRFGKWWFYFFIAAAQASDLELVVYTSISDHTASLLLCVSLANISKIIINHWTDASISLTSHTALAEPPPKKHTTVQWQPVRFQNHAATSLPQVLPTDPAHGQQSGCYSDSVRCASKVVHIVVTCSSASCASA